LLAPENQAGLSRRALERGVADDSEEMEKAVLDGMIKDAEAIARARKEPAGGFQAAAQPSEPEPKPASIEPAPKRSVPYAAPVTRGAPSISSGTAIPTTVTLSPEERSMARLSYRDLPPAEAERLCADMKRRMIVAKANGTLGQ
jgi:hypothetical protein